MLSTSDNSTTQSAIAFDALAQPEESIGLYCPFVSTLNPHVELVQRRSLSWCVRFGLVPADKAAGLDKSKIGWLVARAFGEASAEHLQLASDWTHLFCLLDDHLERLDSAIEVGALLEGIRTAFDQRSVPAHIEDEPFAHALVELGGRMAQHASPRWMETFSDHLEELFTAFTWERINARLNLQPEASSYVAIRRVTVGLRPLFHIGTLMHGEELPPSVLKHASMRRIADAACNCVGWTNDLCTYEKELDEGERHNLVLVLTSEGALSVHEAAQQVAKMHDQEIACILQLEKHLPHLSAHHAAVVRHVGMLQSWIRGHLDWAQETGRYRPFSKDRAMDSGTWARLACGRSQPIAEA